MKAKSKSKDPSITRINVWTDQEELIPDLEEHSWGFASRYVLVRTDDDLVINARLEGKTKDRLFWYSPAFDDQIDGVIDWMDIPA